MIGVKYCGGCNPMYDRTAFWEKIKRHFGDRTEFELARDEKEYEGLMVLGGCPNCCAAYEHYTTKTAPILVWSDEHYQHTISGIEKVLDKKCDSR